jgi:hypothetical protein
MTAVSREERARTTDGTSRRPLASRRECERRISRRRSETDLRSQMTSFNWSKLRKLPMALARYENEWLAHDAKSAAA